MPDIQYNIKPKNIFALRCDMAFKTAMKPFSVWWAKLLKKNDAKLQVKP